MEQENADGKIEGKPQKETRKTDWLASGTIIFLVVCITVTTFARHSPLDLRWFGGTIVVVDENGDVIPVRSTLPTITVFSHYAPGLFRSETKRTRDFHFWTDGSGDFGTLIPRFPATLFIHYRDGRHATVVDLAQGDPTTGLVITLRPRHSVTGRLVDRTGAPLANYEFRLAIRRWSEGNFRRTVKGTMFESLYSRTNADGFFVVHRLIPGVEYGLRILTHLPEDDGGLSRVTMPILEPEQYQEPFDLGDVVVR